MIISVDNMEDSIPHQLGRLQGQMESVLSNQTYMSHQSIKMESEIKTQITQLIQHMNSRIESVEGRMEEAKERLNKIRWIIGLIGSVAGVVGMFGGQLLLKFFSFNS